MHQIRFRLELRPRPRWGSLQRSPRPPSWIQGVLLLREGRGKGGEGGREGGEKRGRGRAGGRGRESWGEGRGVASWLLGGIDARGSRDLGNAPIRENYSCARSDSPRRSYVPNLKSLAHVVLKIY